VAAPLQHQQQPTRQYLGTVDCLTKLWKDGGVRAVYKGFTVALFGVMTFKSLFIGGYDALKTMLDIERKDNNVLLRLMVAQVRCVCMRDFAMPLHRCIIILFSCR
jgi:hypothetical protein